MKRMAALLLVALLASVADGVRRRRPGGDPDDNAKQANEFQGVRTQGRRRRRPARSRCGSGTRRSAAARSPDRPSSTPVHGEVPQRHDQADREVASPTSRPPQAGAVRRHPARRGPGQPGPPRHGPFVKAGFLQPLDSYSSVYNWADRYPRVAARAQQVQRRRAALRGGPPLRPLPDGRVRRRRSTTRPRCRQRADHLVRLRPPTWPRPSRAASSRWQFGNLDKWPGDPHLPGVIQGAARRQEDVRDLVFAPRGRSTRPTVRGRARRCRTGRRRVTSPGRQRHRATTDSTAVRARARGRS